MLCCSKRNTRPRQANFGIYGNAKSRLFRSKVLSLGGVYRKKLRNSGVSYLETYVLAELPTQDVLVSLIAVDCWHFIFKRNPEIPCAVLLRRVPLFPYDERTRLDSTPRLAPRLGCTLNVSSSQGRKFVTLLPRPGLCVDPCSPPPLARPPSCACLLLPPTRR